MLMIFRTLLFPLAVLLILPLILIGCSSSSTSTPPIGGVGSAETIKIGLQAPLNGEYAGEGQEFQKAVQLLVDQANAEGGYNGRQFDLIVEDDKGDPKEAPEIAHRLVARGVVAVIGAYDSTTTEAVMGIYNEAGILQITPSASATDLTRKGYSRFFRLALTGERQGLYTAKLAKEAYSARNVAVLHDTSVYSRDLANWTRKYLENSDVKVGLVEGFYPQETDFTEILTKTALARVDTIYFAGNYNQGGLILKQAKALGIKSRWLMGNACSNPDLVHIAGKDNAKGVVIISEPVLADLPYPEAKKYSAEYEVIYNQYPDSVWGLMSADSFSVIKYAIEQTAGTEPGVLAEYLHNHFRNFAGITGPIPGFDAQGDRLGTMFKGYVVNEKGEFVVRE